MVATIPDLWPTLELNTVSPGTVLHTQVQYLKAKGNGILDAEVSKITGNDDYVIHRLDLIAPIANGQRYRVLTATHRMEYYPIQIEAECFRPKIRTYQQPDVTIPRGIEAMLGPRSEVIKGKSVTESLTWPPQGDWRRIAWDDTEFKNLLGQVLGSSEVRAAIQSFIARTNELQLTTVENKETDPQSVA